MEFKGTKGQWECNGYNIQVDPKYPLKCATITVAYGTGEESLANAKLISCAPEMLDMLVKISDMCNHFNQIIVRDEIDQLIKKATTI